MDGMQLKFGTAIFNGPLEHVFHHQLFQHYLLGEKRQKTAGNILSNTLLDFQFRSPFHSLTKQPNTKKQQKLVVLVSAELTEQGCFSLITFENQFRYTFVSCVADEDTRDIRRTLPCLTSRTVFP